MNKNNTTRNTGEILPTAISVSEQEDTRLIDVQIYNTNDPSGQEEPSSSESETEAEEPATNNQDEQQEEGTEPAPPPSHAKRKRAAITLVCALCLVLLLGGSLLYVLPLLTMSATVTVIPVTRQISTTTTITVVTGHAATEAQQIAGSLLPSVTMSQATTAQATGTGHQDARPGHGLVTFYNAAPYAQTIAAGTILTGTDGVQIVTEQDAYIPAVSYLTLGQATVAAQSVIAGPGGNIRAADIYGPCCRLNISAVNSAFTGGQEARDYQMVTQQDIDSAAASLKSSLDQSIQAALKTQVQSDQTLITPVSCQQSTTPDQQPGAEAARVHVTVSATCIGASYNTAAYQRLVAHFITQAATRQLGTGYLQTGTIQSSIVQAQVKDQKILLQVKSIASYAYQFTQEQQQQIKALIAGKTKAQATTALLQTPGIQSVSLSVSHGGQIPADPNRIQLTFLVTMS